jgi:hypothetical protein
MALLCQTVKISQAAPPQITKNQSKPKISQKSAGSVEIEKFSKPENVSSGDKYCPQRRKLHAGADCGRFPVKPKSSLSGKMPTENHCCRT